MPGNKLKNILQPFYEANDVSIAFFVCGFVCFTQSLHVRFTWYILASVEAGKHPMRHLQCVFTTVVIGYFLGKPLPQVVNNVQWEFNYTCKWLAYERRRLHFMSLSKAVQGRTRLFAAVQCNAPSSGDSVSLHNTRCTKSADVVTFECNGTKSLVLTPSRIEECSCSASTASTSWTPPGAAVWPGTVPRAVCC